VANAGSNANRQEVGVLQNYATELVMREDVMASNRLMM